MYSIRKRIISVVLIVTFIFTAGVGSFFDKNSRQTVLSIIDPDPMRPGRLTGWDVDIDKKSNVVYDDTMYAGSNNYLQKTGMKSGIDVSKWQGNIDWPAVKASGVEFAIIRVAYRGHVYGELQEDPKFRQNIEGAINAGLKVGVYIFSQAINEAEAQQEADYITSLIGNYPISLPVVMDYEFRDGHTGRLADANLSKEYATKVCKAFCSRVQSKGYTAMVYANKSMLTSYVDGPSIAADYLIWLAEWLSETKNNYTYGGNFDFWQYSSKGRVPGISTNVDLDYWIIKDGIEDFSVTGLYYFGDYGWCYYNQGSIDCTYTGLAYNSNFGWGYVKNGRLDTSYTGFADYNNATWYVQNGRITFDYTGMVLNEYGWWYVENSRLQWDYTGYAQNEYGWWWFENGQIAWDKVGAVYGWDIYRHVDHGKIDYAYTGMSLSDAGEWLYFQNGDYKAGYTGFGENEYGKWYYHNGRIAFDYTGPVKENDTWLYVNQGRVEGGYTGTVNEGSQCYQVQNGIRVDNKLTGMALVDGQWRYVQDDEIQYHFYGMALNEYGWWAFLDGQLQWDFTGVGYNQYGAWWFQNGTIAWGYTGMAFDGAQWYYVDNGKVNLDYTGMALNEYGWWYFSNGQLDWSYTGMALNEYGWWYYSNGKLDWNYTGYGYNEYGRWWYENGRIVCAA